MITIILLSRDNASHLKRALLYYKEASFKGRILVADSSVESAKQEVQAIISDLEAKDFAPMFLDYAHETPFAKKVMLATQQAKTPYTSLAAADDFFSLQTMYDAAWFLKENKDYLFCYGKTYGFTLVNQTFSAYYTGYFDKMSSFEKESGFERLKDFFPRYNIAFYSLFRTAGLQKIAQRVFNFTQTLVIYDNLFMMVALLEGKAKLLNKPFNFRELSDGSYGEILGKKWLTAEMKEKEFPAMKNCLEQVFIEKGMYSPERAALESSKCIEDFFLYRYKLTFPISPTLKVKAKELLPNKVLQKILALKFGIKNYFIDASETYLCNQNSPYYAEFKLIKKLVIESEIPASRVGLEFVKQLRI